MRIMGEIYSKAKQVLIWLGDMEKEESALAIEMLSILAAHDRQSVPDNMIPMVVEAMILILRRQWEALHRLLNRPWFERIWVVQEAAKASQAWVLCGNEQMPWELIIRAGEAMLHNSLNFMFTSHGDVPAGDVQGIYTSAGINSFRGASHNSSDYELLLALLNTLKFKATDPQDKIVWVVGIGE